MKSNFYTLKDLFIYKNRTLFFKKLNEKNVNLKKDNLIYLTGNDNTFFDVYNSNLFTNILFKGYFISKLDKLSSVRNKRVVFNQKLRYLELLQKTPSINYKKLNLASYNNLNIFYDTHHYQNLFNKTYNNRKSFETKFQLFLPFQKEILDKVREYYTNITILIHPTEIITTGKSYTFENLIYYLYKNKLLDNTFENINFILATKDNKIFFKFKLNERFEINRYKRLCNILCKISNNLELDQEESMILNMSDIEDTNIKNDIVDNVKEKLLKNINPDKIEQVDLMNEIDDKINDISIESIDEEDLIQKLENDEEFKEKLKQLSDEIENQEDENIDPRIIDKLTKKQQDVTLNDFNLDGTGKTLEDIINDVNPDKLDIEKIPVNNIHKETTVSILKELDKNYNIKKKNKDIIKMIAAFNNDKECPLYVTKIEKTNTSDSFNKKETIKIHYEDAWKNKHTVTIDYPIIIDNSYVYLNGSKKSLGKQLNLRPIIKSKSNEVIITTNYNKMFMYRFGNKLNNNIDNLKKFLKNEDLLAYKIRVRFGNNKSINNQYINTMEYDEISAFLIELKFKNFFFYFNRVLINEKIYENKFNTNIDISKYTENQNEFIIGFSKDEIFTISLIDSKIKVYDVKLNSVIKEYSSIYYLLIDLFEKNDIHIKEKLNSNSTSKKFIYTRCKISNELIPTIILLGFYNGLEKVLRRYNVNYRFVPKREKIQDNEAIIQFEDGYLIYETMPIRNSILVSGLKELPTKETKFDDLNKFDGYLDYFELTFGSRNKSKGFKNTMDLILDPKTIEVLHNLKLPTNITDVLLYANTLLEDNSCKKINDMQNYRIRSLEIINCQLYKIISNSFKFYKDMHKMGRQDIRITVPQDKLLKEVVASLIVDETSIISPIYEIERLGATNYKGFSGINLDQGFTAEMRSFDESMIGLLGLSSPDSNKIGIVRQLVQNPKIINNLGIIDDQTINYSKLDATNLLTVGELLSPYTSLHSDPPRISMQTIQTKHIIPTKKQTKPLYGTGIEKSLPYMLGSDFVSIAKQDGVIEKVYNKQQLVKIRYKDNSIDYIDISERISKNSNAGMYISNKKDLLLKEGQSFKKGELLAKNSNYFLGDSNDDVMFAKGYLAKIALTGADFTLEDSSMISKKLSNDLTSEITMLKTVKLGPNTNIINIAKKGQHIKTGSELITFEHSFEDADANIFLDSMEDSFANFIETLGNDSIVSKYTGEIVDIVIYYNTDIEKLSPSLKKLVNDYINEIQSKKKLLQSSNNEEIILPSTDKIDSMKIKNEIFEGILIEFYVKINTNLGIGDKIVFDAPLKTIISNVFNDNEEPISEYREEKPIDAIVSQMSVISRMTTDFFNMGYTNKLILEMKEQAKEIWFSK